MKCFFHVGDDRLHAGYNCKPKACMVARSSFKRFCCIAICFTMLLFIAHQAAAHTQEQPITLKVKNASLESVFAEIKRQTGINFIYTRDLLQKAGKITLDVKNESLERALELILKDQPLTYSLVDQYVVIRKKELPAKSIAATDNNPRIVQGTVINDKSEAVVGATVSVKGSRNTTFTDETGRFTLRDVQAGDMLVITSIGYASREVEAMKNGPLIISLQPRVNELQPVAVVISTGYQQISKERIVGSFSQLDSAAFHRRVGMNILDRLNGTVTGVLFNSKSAAVPIQIRGISTVGMAANPSAYTPLIILDNFPYNGTLDNINPNDIKDITVLRDAAAASIWGARAGNGVIVITTKRGSFSQPLRVTATANVTITEKPDLWYFSQMSSSDFIDVEQYLFDKGLYDAELNSTASRPVISPVVEILHKQKNGLLSPEEAKKQIDAFRNLDLRKDMDKYVYRPAVTQQYHLNLTGGSEKISYLLSAGYDMNAINVKGSKPDRRITINSQNTFRLLRKLDLSAGIQLSQAVNKSVAVNSTIIPGGTKTTLYPYAQLASPEGLPLATAKDYRGSYTDTAGGGKLLDWKYRLLDEISNTDHTLTTQFIRIDLGAAYRFNDWLKAELRYQYTNQNAENRDHYSQQTYYARNLINLFSEFQGAKLFRNIPLGGILDMNNTRSSVQNLRGQLSFRRSWNIHEISAMAAAELSESKSSYTSSRLYGYQDEWSTFANNINYSKTFVTYGRVGGSLSIPFNGGEGNGTVNRFISVLGNVSYTLLGKYTAYASARRDGANVFGVHTNNKWKPLWSAGVNWDIAKESFYNLSWMPQLRLRFATGYMGNVSAGRSGLPTIRLSSAAPYTGLPTAIVGDAPNPDLKWEDVRTVNLGVDFGLLKGRLTGNIEWYRKRSSYLIANTPIDPTAGVSKYVVNIAELQGKGVDVNINTVNIRGTINWETTFGFSYNKTVIKKYYNPAGNSRVELFFGPEVNPVEGRMAWGISSYRWAGLDPENGDPRGILNGKPSTDYKALALDSIQHQIFNGSSIPLYSGFLGNTLSWKGLSISANITYRLDYYYRRPAINYSDLYYGWVSNADYRYRWQNPGDEAVTNVPSMNYPAVADRDRFYNYAEVNVKRADNIRMQDLRVSYQWQRPAGMKFPAEKIQVYGYINNLNFILWKKDHSGPDPDVPATSFPAFRSYTIGTVINL